MHSAPLHYSSESIIFSFFFASGGERPPRPSSDAVKYAIIGAEGRSDLRFPGKRMPKIPVKHESVVHVAFPAKAVSFLAFVDTPPCRQGIQ